MAVRLPADLVNRALDSIGADTAIGDLSDGTRVSEAARRNYGRILRELLCAAHWNFARKSDVLLLLADATGETKDSLDIPYPTDVETPWRFAYAWPSDGVAPRWLAAGIGALPTTGVPQTAASNTAGVFARPVPARFLVSSTEQYPDVGGSMGWDSLPQLPEGQGLISRRIVLANTAGASLVYTKLVLDPEEWDALFEQAFVACLASRLAMAALDDKKRAMAERAAQIAITKDALAEARVHNANDTGFPQSINRVAPWIAARRGGFRLRGGLGADAGSGELCYGWSAMGFADGSVF